MDQENPQIPEATTDAAPDPKTKSLDLEDQFWAKVLQDPENTGSHKTYVGHILRAGLLREGARRYRPLVDDTEHFSIDARRLARFYQKQIVNVLFMTPSAPRPKPKNPTLGYIFAFIAVMFILTGIFDYHYWYLALAGTVYIVPYIYRKYNQAKDNLSRSKVHGIPTDQL